jgi:hypothetical protein
VRRWWLRSTPRDPRAAGLGEVLPPLTGRQIHQHIRASRIGAESLDQPG